MLDNDDASLVSDRDDVRKFSVHPWSIAQFVVLLTGIALTLTSYVMLNMLIQQVLRDDISRQLAVSQQIVRENLLDMSAGINMGATLISLSEAHPEATLKKYIQESGDFFSRFEKLAFISYADSEKGEWFEIHDHGSMLISEQLIENIKDALSLVKEDARARMVVMRLPFSDLSIREFEGYQIKEMPLIIAKASESEGKVIGLVLGVAHLGSIVNERLLDRSTSILSLSVSDLRNDQILYSLYKKLDPEEENSYDPVQNAFTFIIGHEQWSVAVVVGKSRQTLLLEGTPWLMLLFGIALTTIGISYVRSNQRQAFKMAIMNRQLAQKNYELNTGLSERERLNQVLRKAEREYRAIIDSVSDIIFESSVRGEILFFNDTWEKVVGTDTEQALGKSLFDFLHPNDQKEQRENFLQLVQGRKGAYRSLTRLRTTDGSYRSVELAVSMLRQDENKNMRVVGTITDVEERYRAEHALSEAEEKYRTIVENAAGGIYQVTPEGKFLSVNPAMAWLLGYQTPASMIEDVQDAHVYLHASLKDRTTYVRELETRGVLYNYETEIKTKDGKRLWVNENARAVKGEDGCLLYYEGSMEDISARKLTEMKLREAKMQSDLASRAKSEFLANMSHELRTPLNAIIGFSEIIKNEVLGSLGNRQYWEYARDIHDSGQKLLSIINEILDVSYIESGERQINEGIVNLRHVVQSCIDFVGNKAALNEIKVRDMTDAHLPDVLGEELALKQVLINLLSNAIKFTPENGRVSVSYEIELSGCLRLSVTDTGVGMSESEIEKAFSPFGQVEASFNRTASGSGLGLTLARSLVELHDGDLEVFSQKGVGTAVSIVLPSKRVLKRKTSEDKSSESVATKEEKEGSFDVRENDDKDDPDQHQIH